MGRICMSCGKIHEQRIRYCESCGKKIRRSEPPLMIKLDRNTIMYLYKDGTLRFQYHGVVYGPYFITDITNLELQNYGEVIFKTSYAGPYHEADGVLQKLSEYVVGVSRGREFLLNIEINDLRNSIIVVRNNDFSHMFKAISILNMIKKQNPDKEA